MFINNLPQERTEGGPSNGDLDMNKKEKHAYLTERLGLAESVRTSAKVAYPVMMRERGIEPRQA
jgi:hypothetical protein